MKRRSGLLAKPLLTAVFAGLAMAGAGAAEPPAVVASIKPVHSLVAAVMAGVAVPHLIVTGAASPHTHSLLPSDAEALAGARLVFWIGPGMETFLASSIGSLAAPGAVVRLADAPGIASLPFREIALFAADGDHHESDAEAHEPEGGEEAGREPPAADEHAHEAMEDAGHDHEHGGTDMHLWLDPDNAIAMVREIESRLGAADPANAKLYAANAAALQSRIAGLARDIAAMLEPVRDRPFIVFHDGYQYFEKHFDLHAAGSITVSPDRAPGAKRLAGIRDRVRGLSQVCVFAEPRFEPRIIAAVTEGTGALTGVLDPLGADLEDGPELYPALMRNLARSFSDCLAATS
jgi:zinc transport system substrate-binding protein